MKSWRCEGSETSSGRGAGRTQPQSRQEGACARVKAAARQRSGKGAGCMVCTQGRKGVSWISVLYGLIIKIRYWRLGLLGKGGERFSQFSLGQVGRCLKGHVQGRKFWSLGRAVTAGVTDAGKESGSSVSWDLTLRDMASSTWKSPIRWKPSSKTSTEAKGVEMCKKRKDKWVESNYGLGRENCNACMNSATCSLLANLELDSDKRVSCPVLWGRGASLSQNPYSHIKNPHSVRPSLFSNSWLPWSLATSAGGRKTLCSILNHPYCS